ncbi:hypothetical protein HYH02_005329 [Chlamydomonas schloesseri]|uniref:Uncharacterized protein n=1 Tax=Chlamydomonas schloesseri TaxID=2026947 RepID=A0A835WMS5_9CHLO|nr:hypothetical protein HYH02_005329 [Chlamydomonas schloesseri]|eukprot:KAG2449806.1 hypothetical protein HYH02_005329 [Chlamydomonas schloesseri]
MPFGLGAAFGGVARAAARLRNRGNARDKQGDLFFPEDEATDAALECSLPGECLESAGGVQCQLGQEREVASLFEETQPEPRRPESGTSSQPLAQALVQPLEQPDFCDLKEEYVQAVASASCDDPAGQSDFCSVGSFEARRRAVSVRKVCEWDLAAAVAPCTPEPGPDSELSGSRESSSGGASPDVGPDVATAAPVGGAGAQPTQVALQAALPATGNVNGSSGSSGGDTAASGASFGQLPSSSSSGSPTSSVALPDPLVVVPTTAAAIGSAAASKGTVTTDAQERAAQAAKAPASMPAPVPSSPASAAAREAGYAAGPAVCRPSAGCGRGAGGSPGSSRLAAVGLGDVLCGTGPQAAVALALGGRAPVHGGGYSAPHVVRAAVAASSRAVVATAAAMARPHPAALPAVPPPIVLRDANDVPLPAAQQLAARASSMASRGSSARHSLDAIAAGAVAGTVEAADAAADAAAAEAEVVDSPLPPSILETRPPDLSSLMAIKQQVEVLRLMHLQRQAAALLAMPAAGRGGAIGNMAAPPAAAGTAAGAGARARPLDLAGAAAAAVAEVRAALAAAEAAATRAGAGAGAGGAADGRSSSGSVAFTASSQQTSASQVPYTASPPASPIKSTLSVTAMASGSPVPSLSPSPLRPSVNGQGTGHTRHFSVDASPSHASSIQQPQQAAPGKAATGVGYSAPSGLSTTGGTAPRPPPPPPPQQQQQQQQQQQYNYSAATVGGGSAAAAGGMGDMPAASLSAPVQLVSSPPPRSPPSGSNTGMSSAMSPADIQRQQAQLQQQIEALQRQIAAKQQTAARSPSPQARSPAAPVPPYQPQMMTTGMMGHMMLMTAQLAPPPQQAWPADAIQAAARNGMTLQYGSPATSPSSPMHQQQHQQLQQHLQQQQVQQLSQNYPSQMLGQYAQQQPHHHAGGHSTGARASASSSLNNTVPWPLTEGRSDGGEGGEGEGELLSSHPSFRQHLHDPVPVAEAARRTQDWLASTAEGGAVPPPPVNGGHDPTISPNGSAHGGTKSALKRDPSVRLSPHPPAAYGVSPSPSSATQPWQQQQPQQQQQQQQPSRSPSPPPALARAPSTRQTRFADPERTSPNSARSPSPSPLARSASQLRGGGGGGGAGGGGEGESSPSGTGGSTSQSGMAMVGRTPSLTRTPSLSRTPSLLRSPSRRGPSAVPAELLDNSNGPVPLWRIASFNRQLSVSQPSMVRRQKSISSQNSGGDGAQSSHRSSSRRHRESSKAKAKREAAVLQAKVANGPPPSPLALMGAKLLHEAGEKLQPAPRLPTGRAFFVPLRPDLRLDVNERDNTNTDSPVSGLSPAESRDMERGNTQGDIGSARSVATGSAAGWGRG